MLAAAAKGAASSAAKGAKSGAGAVAGKLFGSHAYFVVAPWWIGIYGAPKKKELTCHFNPTTLKISAGASWADAGDGGRASLSHQLPKPQFQNPEPRKLSVELLFDDWARNRSPVPGVSVGNLPFTGDVSKDIETLISWTRAYTKDRERFSSPVVRFHWGTKTYFEAYLTKVEATYQLFGKDGRPLRATAEIDLVEYPALRPGQNPTSGGVPGRRSHTVAAGETLQSIAFAEYGEPRLWRGLAEFNAIDDPMRLSTGSALLIPPVEEARARS